MTNKTKLTKRKISCAVHKLKHLKKVKINYKVSLLKEIVLSYDR